MHYPMIDSIIKQVEAFGSQDNLPGMFDFADCTGILFEWNEEVDEACEQLLGPTPVDFPYLPAKIPGVALRQDEPVPAVEAEILPNGALKVATADKTNLGPFDPAILAGVIHDDNNNDKYNVHYADAKVNIPEHEAAQQILADDGDKHEDKTDTVLDADTGDSKNDSDSDSEEDDDGNEEPVPPNNLRRSMRDTHGQTARYEDYALMLHAMRSVRGGP